VLMASCGSSVSPAVHPSCVKFSSPAPVRTPSPVRPDAALHNHMGNRPCYMIEPLPPDRCLMTSTQQAHFFCIFFENFCHARGVISIARMDWRLGDGVDVDNNSWS
jgi:hypothetical protein